MVIEEERLFALLEAIQRLVVEEALAGRNMLKAKVEDYREVAQFVGNLMGPISAVVLADGVIDQEVVDQGERLKSGITDSIFSYYQQQLRPGGEIAAILQERADRKAALRVVKSDQ